MYGPIFLHLRFTLDLGLGAAHAARHGRIILADTQVRLEPSKFTKNDRK